MESIDLELGDLFDRDAVDADSDGEDIGAITGAREDADDGTEGGRADEPEGDEVLSNLQKLAKGAAKKRVMRPQPKLDAQRLKSDRGLPALPKLFKDVKFSGRGREADDLKLLMSRLEHWAHRLFPKLAFDDFIERLEKLGSKKEIQTCVKRIRLDMPILDSDFVAQLDEDDGIELPSNNGDDVADAEEAFDDMMRRERDLDGDVSAGTPARTPGSQQQSNVASTPSFSSAASTQNSPALSSEQQQRIERNRQIAMQKRAERLAAATGSNISTVNSSVSPDNANRCQATPTQPPTADPVSMLDGAVDQTAESGKNPTVRSVDADGGQSPETLQTFDEILDNIETDN